MVILGINGGEKREEQYDDNVAMHHDAAAVLVCDGELVAAIEEERLSRIKRTNCFPRRAIQRCLDIAKTTLSDVDLVAVNSDSRFVEDEDMGRCLFDSTRPFALGASSVINRMFQRDFAVDVRAKLRFCHHHYAHAWSAYAISGFSEGLVVSIDGWGDDCCGMVFEGSARSLKLLRRYTSSVGGFYTSAIRLLGFGDFEEYKAMGLASYGDKGTYGSLFRQGYRLLPDGTYELGNTRFWTSLFVRSGLAQRARRKGEPFAQSHKDVAAAAQNVVEDIILHILRHFALEIRCENLCLAGGVAHNCVLNGRILESALFKNVFVHPAAHDAGGAMGAAYAVAIQENPKSKIATVPHMFFGTDITCKPDVESVLEAWSDAISFERVEAAQTAARWIADGHIVGWVQGRSEFGPRALGNRSILADPRPEENKDRINKIIKKRESFRPFAPSVPEERIADYFEVPKARAALDFMTYVLRVRDEMRTVLRAVTHVDGTARVHGVRQQMNPRFWQLLMEFGKLSGIPVLLNTSFNLSVEPIVDSVHDAIVCYLTSDLERLIVGDYAIHRCTPRGRNQLHLNFVPLLPSYCRLEVVARYDQKSAEMKRAHCVVHVKGRAANSSDESESGPLEREIPEGLFQVLHNADGRRSLHELFKYAAIEQTAQTGLLDHLQKLWTERMIVMRPYRSETSHGNLKPL